MRTRNIADILLIVAFCLCLMLPLVFADFEGGKSSEAENRFMATAPRIFTENGLYLKNIKTDFEAWLDDNVGGRTQMVAANTWLNYTLFRQSVHKTTLIGREDWAYYLTDEILRDYQRTNLLSDGELAAWAGSLRTVQDNLEAQGISFLFCLAPDKKTVYPEYYPNAVLRLSDTTRSHQLSGAALEAGVSFLLLEEPLLLAKESDPLNPLYSHQLDTSHWNALGALTSYQAIMEPVQQLLPGTPELRVQRFLSPDAQNDIATDVLPDTDATILRTVGQGMFQGVLPIAETDYELTLLHPAETVRDEAFFSDMDQLSYAGNRGEFALRLVRPGSGLPKLLYVGDSYYEALLPLLSESFSEVTFLHIADAEHLQTLVDKAQPDIVIVEMVERMVDGHFSRFLALAESYAQ